jgi:hypothetical protein
MKEHEKEYFFLPPGRRAGIFLTGPGVEQPEDAKRLKGGTQGTNTLLVGMGSYFLRGWVGKDILMRGA